MIQTLINGLVVVSFFAFFILMISMAKEGKDERTLLISNKLFRGLYSFIIMGLALMLFTNGWTELDFSTFKTLLSLLLSLHLFFGLGYWFYLLKTH
ncbi:hypothetical protein ACNA6I_17735 [Rossellomorea sp. FS2]|uniref:hypothetical protein n=1 Tax=Rossellomorea sp. FS2 TaxID=3391447 RepID=UPI003A4E1909